MVFSASIFLFAFLPFVLAITALLPIRRQNVFLLAASLVFYAWGEVFFVLAMLASITVNYGVGLLMGRVQTQGGLRWALSLGVVFNLCFLASFKYANFAVDQLNMAMAQWGSSGIELSEVHLPIGVSFFTFQAMSYLIDVYRGDTEVQRKPIDFGLYIALFPQLIAGPIVRYRDIAAQLVDRQRSDRESALGIERFIIGLAKKVLIANPAGILADQLFAIEGSELTTALAWTAALAYTVQIYFDFSGYSDMAIGLGRFLGFRFPENFRWPYISQSVTEFWRRWHISLSSWFRDYLYIPLGGNRGGTAKTYRNLILVFFLCGLWHGASWNFAIWGLYHGLFLVMEKWGLGPFVARCPRVLRHFYVMLVAVVGWVPFKAETLGQSMSMLSAMFMGGDGDGAKQNFGMYLDTELPFVAVAALIGSTPLVDLCARRLGFWGEVTDEADRDDAPVYRRVLGRLFLGLCLVLCFVQITGSTQDPFIYFRF